MCFLPDHWPPERRGEEWTQLSSPPGEKGWERQAKPSADREWWTDTGFTLRCPGSKSLISHTSNKVIKKMAIIGFSIPKNVPCYPQKTIWTPLPGFADCV